MSDTGDLLGAHVSSIKNELAEGLHDLRDRIRAAVFAAAAGIATAVALILAIGTSLVALGLAPWIAYWIVAAVAVLGLVVMARRAATAKKGRSAGHPGEAIARAGNDAAWLADRASDAVT